MGKTLLTQMRTKTKVPQDTAKRCCPIDNVYSTALETLNVDMVGEASTLRHKL